MSEVVDLKDVLERVQDDKELLFELFDIFTEDFVGKRNTFWEAFEKGDVSQFQMISHGLKGASGNISAMQMHQNCVELDKIAKDGDIATAKERLELLDKQFEDLKVEIARLKVQEGIA